MNSKFRNRLTAVPATVLKLSLSVALVSSFHAADASDRDPGLRQYRVQFGDLDLRSERGTAVLYSRIKSAAAYVCEPLLSPGGLSAQQGRKCEADAITRALADVKAHTEPGVYLVRAS